MILVFLVAPPLLSPMTRREPSRLDSPLAVSQAPNAWQLPSDELLQAAKLGGEVARRGLCAEAINIPFAKLDGGECKTQNWILRTGKHDRNQI